MVLIFVADDPPRSPTARGFDVLPTPPTPPRAPKMVSGLGTAPTPPTVPKSSTGHGQSNAAPAPPVAPNLPAPTGQPKVPVPPAGTDRSDGKRQCSTSDELTHRPRTGSKTGLPSTPIDATALPTRGSLGHASTPPSVHQNAMDTGKQSPSPVHLDGARSTPRSTIDAVAPVLNRSPTHVKNRPAPLNLTATIKDIPLAKTVQLRPVPSPRQHRRHLPGDRNVDIPTTTPSCSTTEQVTRVEQRQHDQPPQLPRSSPPRQQEIQATTKPSSPLTQFHIPPPPTHQPATDSLLPGVRLVDEDDSGYARIKPRQDEKSRAGDAAPKPTTPTIVSKPVQATSLAPEITVDSDAPYARVMKTKKSKEGTKKPENSEQDDTEPPQLPPRFSDDKEEESPSSNQAQGSETKKRKSANGEDDLPENLEEVQPPPPLPELSEDEQRANAERIAKARQQHQMRRARTQLSPGSSAQMVGAAADRRASEEKRFSFGSSPGTSPLISPGGSRGGSPGSSPNVGRKRSTSDSASLKQLRKPPPQAPLQVVDSPLALIVAKAAARSERVARGESKSLADSPESAVDRKQEVGDKQAKKSGEIDDVMRSRAQSDGQIMRQKARPPPPNKRRPSSESYDGMPETAAARQQKPSRPSGPLLQMILDARGMSDGASSQDKSDTPSPHDGNQATMLTSSLGSDSVFFEDLGQGMVRSASSLSEMADANLWDNLSSSPSTTFNERPVSEDAGGELLLSPAPGMFADNDLAVPGPPSGWLDDTDRHHSALGKQPSTIDEEDEDETVDGLGPVPAPPAAWAAPDEREGDERRLSWLVSTFVPPPPEDSEEAAGAEAMVNALLPPGPFHSKDPGNEDEEEEVIVPPPAIPGDFEVGADQRLGRVAECVNSAKSGGASPSPRLRRKLPDRSKDAAEKVNTMWVYVSRCLIMRQCM